MYIFLDPAALSSQLNNKKIRALSACRTAASCPHPSFFYIPLFVSKCSAEVFVAQQQPVVDVHRVHKNTRTHTDAHIHKMVCIMHSRTQGACFRFDFSFLLLLCILQLMLLLRSFITLSFQSLSHQLHEMDNMPYPAVVFDGLLAMFLLFQSGATFLFSTVIYQLVHSLKHFAVATVQMRKYFISQGFQPPRGKHLLLTSVFPVSYQK